MERLSLRRVNRMSSLTPRELVNVLVDVDARGILATFDLGDPFPLEDLAEWFTYGIALTARDGRAWQRGPLRGRSDARARRRHVAAGFHRRVRPVPRHRRVLLGRQSAGVGPGRDLLPGPRRYHRRRRCAGALHLPAAAARARARRPCAASHIVRVVRRVRARGPHVRPSLATQRTIA